MNQLTAIMTITPRTMDIDEDHRPRYLVFSKVMFCVLALVGLHSVCCCPMQLENQPSTDRCEALVASQGRFHFAFIPAVAVQCCKVTVSVCCTDCDMQEPIEMKLFCTAANFR